MLNKAVVVGRFTKDPELKYTKSNVPVVSFSLACDDDFADRDGNKDTDFIDVVVWRGLAELVSKWCTKGMLVGVTGRIKTRSWKDKDGNNRKSVEIKADEVHFLGSKQNTENTNTNTNNYAPTDFEEMAADDGGELPF